MDEKAEAEKLTKELHFLKNLINSHKQKSVHQTSASIPIRNHPNVKNSKKLSTKALQSTSRSAAVSTNCLQAQKSSSEKRPKKEHLKQKSDLLKQKLEEINAEKERLLQQHLIKKNHLQSRVSLNSHDEQTVGGRNINKIQSKRIVIPPKTDASDSIHKIVKNVNNGEVLQKTPETKVSLRYSKATSKLPIPCMTSTPNVEEISPFSFKSKHKLVKSQPIISGSSFAPMSPPSSLFSSTVICGHVETSPVGNSSQLQTASSKKNTLSHKFIAKPINSPNHSPRKECATNMACSFSKKHRDQTIVEKSKYKFVKNHTVPMCSSKRGEKQSSSKYSLIRCNSDQDSKRKLLQKEHLKRNNSLLSANRTAVPLNNIVVKSKYKLVKKAVITIQRQQARRKSMELKKNVGMSKHMFTKSGFTHQTQNHGKRKSQRSRYAFVKSSNDLHGAVTPIDANHILRARISNVSKNRYKFINAHNKPQPWSTRTRIKLTPKELKQQAKLALKLDRRTSVQKCRLVRNPRSAPQPRSSRRVVLSPRLNLSVSKSPLGKGKANGYRLGSDRYKLVRESSTQTAARLVVAKSLLQVHNKQRVGVAVKQYCLFYNRFGKCKRGNQCKHIHDPARITICTRFLRGTCSVVNCPFSHHLSAGKLPTCRFFVRGKCTADSCPYRHVNVGKTAAICQAFVEGLCPKGDQCKKQHTLICPEYQSTGACPRGKKCLLRHLKNSPRKWKITDNIGLPKKNVHKHSADVEQSTPSSDSPPGSLPSFIALHDSSEDREDGANVHLEASGKSTSRKIRPRFSLGSFSNEKK